MFQLFSLADEDEDEDEDDLVFSRTIVGGGQKGRRPPLAVYKLALLSAVGGFLFGYDTGVVSGAMVLVRKARQNAGLSQCFTNLVIGISINALITK